MLHSGLGLSVLNAVLAARNHMSAAVEQSIHKLQCLWYCVFAIIIALHNSRREETLQPQNTVLPLCYWERRDLETTE